MNRQSGMISVIICSAGRPEFLEATLASLQKVHVPSGCPVELLLVDNNPQPAYTGLLERFEMPAWKKRHIHEPQRGLSVARNRGLAEANGEIIAFTDDDLRFEPDFLTELTKQLLNGSADAAAGAIRLAPELEEEWMEPWHRIAFASTEHLDMSDPRGFVGANFAIHSRVLKDVPEFDKDLGAGKLGTGEETVFAKLLIAAGYRIVGVPSSVVWHHFDPSRKSRENLVRASEAWGRSNAHIDHFYNGVRLGRIGLRRYKTWLQLKLHRLLHRRKHGSPMDVRESTLIKNLAYYRALEEIQNKN